MNADLFREVLVADRPRGGRAQEGNPLGRTRRNEHILVGVGFPPSSVVLFLFFSVFRAWTTPIRAINNQIATILVRALVLGELRTRPLGGDAQVI